MWLSVATTLTTLVAGTHAVSPVLFWASFPVLPNETVVIAGSGFATANGVCILSPNFLILPTNRRVCRVCGATHQHHRIWRSFALTYPCAQGTALTPARQLELGHRVPHAKSTRVAQYHDGCALFGLAIESPHVLHHMHTAPCLAPQTHSALPCTTYTHRLTLHHIHAPPCYAPHTHIVLPCTTCTQCLHHHTAPCTTDTQCFHHHTSPSTTDTKPCTTEISVRLPCHVLLVMSGGAETLFVWCTHQRGNTFCRAGLPNALRLLVHAHARGSNPTHSAVLDYQMHLVYLCTRMHGSNPTLTCEHSIPRSRTRTSKLQGICTHAQ
jgi:hypothetical protein